MGLRGKREEDVFLMSTLHILVCNSLVTLNCSLMHPQSWESICLVRYSTQNTYHGAGHPQALIQLILMK